MTDAFIVTPYVQRFTINTRQCTTLRKRPRSVASRSLIRMDSTLGYVPSEDDRPEGVPNIPTELTLSQQLLLRQYEDQVERMSTQECQELALEVARQMLVKDNILRTMLKKDFNSGVDIPDPAKFKRDDGRADNDEGGGLASK